MVKFTMFAVENNQRINSDTLKLLVEFRLSTNKVKALQCFNQRHWPQLKLLVETLGRSILKSHSKTRQNEPSYTQDKNRFCAFLDWFFAKNLPYTSTLYAAELLQYYTVLCEESLSDDFRFNELQAFLSANQHRLGDTHTNPFMIEYRLITIYADLNRTDDEKSLPPPDEASLQIYTDYLGNLIELLNKWLEDESENTFFHYLLFAAHYSYAKATEQSFKTNQPSLDLEETNQMIALQEAHIKLAMDAISKLERLQTHFEQRGDDFPKGIEFSFAKNILYHLPIQDIAGIKEHLNDLLSPQP